MAVEIFAAGRFLLLFVGWGGLSVGCRTGGPRWLRGSTIRRYYGIAPSSVSCADSYGLRWLRLDLTELSPGQFDPQGEAYVLCYVVVFAAVVFYISPTGLAKSLPLGGKVGRTRRGRVG